MAECCWLGLSVNTRSPHCVCAMYTIDVLACAVCPRPGSPHA